ncbi:MAG: hypothetical protein JNN08_24870 [Bryobacterales bacterium]|nr:hypothetical protein [Bryobacterales bacterium]
MKRPAVTLHIEHLVLHGVGTGERDRAAAAIERCLGELVRERGLPGGVAGDGAHARPRVKQSAGSYESIAEAIWRSLAP